MKKLLFATLFCLITLYAVQAQTKEETITWLQEKLKKNVTLNCYECEGVNYDVQVSECFITIKYSVLQNSGKKYVGLKDIIPIQGVELSVNDIKMKDKSSSVTHIDSEGNATYGFSTALNLRKADENLFPRLQKAVDHLATFCPKKQETF